jgi:TonB family protein
MGPQFRIVFEEDGFPRELVNAADRERAVREETLTADMSVTVYRPGQPPGVFRAGDIKELRALFGIGEPEAPAAVAPPPAEPPAGSSVRQGQAAAAPPSPPVAPDAAAAAPSPTPLVPPVDDPQPADPYLPRTHFEPRPDTSSRAVGISLVVLLVFALYVIGQCSNRTMTMPNSVSGNQAATGTDMSMDTNMSMDTGPTGPAPVSDEEIGASVMRYLVRETNVRAEPTAQSGSIALVGRGEMVQGVYLSGHDARYRWLKITTGPNAGYFVAESNLSDLPRPSLDTSFSGRMTVSQPMPINAQPNRSSAVIDNANPGLALNVVGVTQDGMAELSLRSGGIGYIDSRAFFANNDSGESLPESRPPPADAPAPAQRAAPYVPPPSYAPPQQQQPQRAQLIAGTPQVGEADYPSRSSRNGETGSVRYVVTVGSDGRVVDCRITGSSGFGALDDQTCRLMRSRSRFRPAIGSDGKPASDTYSGTMNWRLD